MSSLSTQLEDTMRSHRVSGAKAAQSSHGVLGVTYSSPAVCVWVDYVDMTDTSICCLMGFILKVCVPWHNYSPKVDLASDWGLTLKCPPPHTTQLSCVGVSGYYWHIGLLLFEFWKFFVPYIITRALKGTPRGALTLERGMWMCRGHDPLFSD